MSGMLLPQEFSLKYKLKHYTVSNLIQELLLNHKCRYCGYRMFWEQVGYIQNFDWWINHHKFAGIAILSLKPAASFFCK